jgi:hydroxypyruvate reductase 1
MKQLHWRTVNPDGRWRVVVTKELPGTQWLRILQSADCRIDICDAAHALDVDAIQEAIGTDCQGAIGQLTEPWGDRLFAALQQAGGRVYSNYAVGFNNVDLEAATRHGIPVGNTPGVLTETTAEMAVALTLAAARRTGESERFMRAGKFAGWLPDLFLGKLLRGGTVGVIGAGRIGATYGRMMVEGFKMHLVYCDVRANIDLEAYIRDYSALLQSQGDTPVTCRRLDTIEAVLKTADCVSIHTILDASTHHLIDAGRLALMKADAVLVNTSRGPVIDEAALVNHCRTNPEFRVGLDVFEQEPATAPGLADLENVVMVPHIASATRWTREGMAVLAASNVAAVLQGYPAWQQESITPFLGDESPRAAPSLLNAEGLGYPVYE